MTSGQSRSLLGIITAALQGALFWHFKDLENPGLLLKLQLSLSPTRFSETLAELGSYGTELVRTHYLLDTFYPLAYAALLSAFVPRSLGKIYFLPAAAALLDLVENGVHYGLITGHIPLTSDLFYLGAAAAWGKWGFIWTTIGVIVCSRMRPARK